MGRTVKKGSVTFWAWAASIGLHLIVLTVFGVVKFSRPGAIYTPRTTPFAKVSRIQKLMNAAPRIPKPKVSASTKNQIAKNSDKKIPVSKIFQTPKTNAPDWSELSKQPSSQKISSLENHTVPQSTIKLFGSRQEQRKICYLVDCSGSMQGVFGRVRNELKDSIRDLQPDQYFYIIFFAGERIFELGNGRLIRATENSKTAACDLIDQVQPVAQTNALPALKIALQVRDNIGDSPAVIYFLTDGFELTEEDAWEYSLRIKNLLSLYAPTTKINTIGFWPDSRDQELLELIALQSGGEFFLVTDSNN